MDTILLSHAMYKPGMDVLEGKADIIIPDNGNSDEILSELQKADAFILRIGRIDRKAIESCPKLRVITRPGVGVDSVDVDAATKHGIPVVICPAVNARAVAEHSLSLLFTLSKNLVESDLETRKGNFNIRNKYASTEILGKTLTILGFGNIGKELAAMCFALGMKICIYDPFVKKEQVEEFGYRYFSGMTDAVSAGDFVSIHIPSTPRTVGMVNDTFLSAMKQDAFLINCSRGDLVIEKDLVEALAAGKIAGAGLDVLVDEPMPAEHPLMKMSNVVITPHMAAQTRETTSRTVVLAAESTLKVLAGEKIPNVCNPEVYEHERWKSL